MSTRVWRYKCTKCTIANYTISAPFINRIPALNQTGAQLTSIAPYISMHFNEILIDLIILALYLCYIEIFIFYLLENCLILKIQLIVLFFISSWIQQPGSEFIGLSGLKDTVRWPVRALYESHLSHLHSNRSISEYFTCGVLTRHALRCRPITSPHWK